MFHARRSCVHCIRSRKATTATPIRVRERAYQAENPIQTGAPLDLGRVLDLVWTLSLVFCGGNSVQVYEKFGTPERIRTTDLLLRRQTSRSPSVYARRLLPPAPA